MSLEEAIRENTAALKEQTALLKSKLGGGAAASSTSGKPATDKPATDKPATTSKKVTLDTIKEKFGAFLGVEDKKVRAKRIEAVGAMMNHFGVAKASLLEAEQWPEALGYLKQLEAGETPDYANEGEDGDGDDESLV